MIDIHSDTQNHVFTEFGKYLKHHFKHLKQLRLYRKVSRAALKSASDVRQSSPYATVTPSKKRYQHFSGPGGFLDRPPKHKVREADGGAVDYLHHSGERLDHLVRSIEKKNRMLQEMKETRKLVPENPASPVAPSVSPR